MKKGEKRLGSEKTNSWLDNQENNKTKTRKRGGRQNKSFAVNGKPAKSIKKKGEKKIRRKSKRKKSG